VLSGGFSADRCPRCHSLPVGRWFALGGLPLWPLGEYLVVSDERCFVARRLGLLAPKQAKDRRRRRK
jgi:hypothetical protein